MSVKLNCPVCGYQEIESNTCPNCDTDLSLIRMLQELPVQQEPRLKFNLGKWQLFTALCILIISSGLATVEIAGFFSPQLITNTISHPLRVNVSKPITKSIVNTPSLTRYTVKVGDSLTAIAEKYCGKGISWKIIAQANPQLKGQENNLEIGDNLIIPPCQEHLPEVAR